MFNIHQCVQLSSRVNGDQWTLTMCGSPVWTEPQLINSFSLAAFQFYTQCVSRKPHLGGAKFIGIQILSDKGNSFFSCFRMGKIDLSSPKICWAPHFFFAFEREVSEKKVGRLVVCLFLWKHSLKAFLISQTTRSSNLFDLKSHWKAPWIFYDAVFLEIENRREETDRVPARREWKVCISSDISTFVTGLYIIAFVTLKTVA